MFGVKVKGLHGSIRRKIRMISPDLSDINQEVPRGSCMQLGRHSGLRRNRLIITYSPNLLMHNQMEGSGRTTGPLFPK